MLVSEPSVPLALSSTNFLIFTPFSVSISDPLFVLYNDWIQEIRILVIVLMIIFTLLISLLYLSLKGKWSAYDSNLSFFQHMVILHFL